MAIRLAKGEGGRRYEEDAFAAFGLANPEESADDVIEVWPENAHAVAVFGASGTQWERGFGGGLLRLRYEALPMMMRYCGVPPEERTDTFHALRIMEAAVLAGCARE